MSTYSTELGGYVDEKTREVKNCHPGLAEIPATDGGPGCDKNAPSSEKNLVPP